MKAIWSFGKNMKAVRISKFGGIGVLKVQLDVPVPEPNENQILMKVAYSGVNPVDTYMREGAWRAKPDLPYSPGKDGAGTVARLGANVNEFKVGDRVFTAKSATGTTAEYCLVDKDFVWPLGDCLSFQQGAAIGIPYFTAYRALFMRANAKDNKESVLVHGGSGAVGLAACQLAKAAGLTVFGTAGTLGGMEMVLKAGAEHVFNHREEGYMEKIQEATGGEGVDIIIEMLANKNLAQDVPLLRRHGRVVVGSRGALQFDPRLTMIKETSVLGVALYTSELEDWKIMGNAIVAGIKSGAINPFVHLEYPLEKTAVAHDEVIKHSDGGAKGKMVIKISD
ncbi:quinone oxidoreductase-like isoform X2 [Lineus longissimus]|uniref:quinone oxidoreductase-like isoform X2 n=1 Tax=Lineus longissimus TaxID=88925 RepID=UPI00315D8A8A